MLLPFLNSSLNRCLALRGSYNPFLVVLSIIIASCAAFVAFQIVEMIQKSEDKNTQNKWLVLGAFVMGGGIWAMHFVGMLAFSVGMTTNFNLAVTLISMVPGIIASGASLYFMRDRSIGFWRLNLAGLCMGLGIGVMHYTGMAAMITDAQIYYDPLMFSLSIVVAYLLAMVSLYLYFVYKNNQGEGKLKNQIISAVIMGSAVSGMHYTGMLATVFFYKHLTTVSGFLPVGSISPVLFGIIIAVVSLSIMAVLVINIFNELYLARMKAQNVFLESKHFIQHNWKFTGLLIASGVILVGIGNIFYADHKLDFIIDDFANAEGRVYQGQRLIAGIIVIMSLLFLYGIGVQYYRRYILNQMLIDQKLILLSRIPDEDPSPIIRVSVNGKILYANKASLFILDHFQCQVGAGFPEQWQSYVQESVRSNSVKRVEIQIDYRTYVHIFTPVSEFSYVNIYLIDITGLKETEKKLFTQNEGLEKIVGEKVKGIKDIKFALDQHLSVAVTDVEGKILLVNDKFCEISQYSREELLGQDHRMMNSGYHPQEFMRELWRTIEQGHVWKGEIKNKARDGSYFWLDTTIVPFLNDNGKPYQYITVRTDITDRILYQERLHDQILIAEESSIKAQVATHAKSDFLSNMSHEIRTPMNAILGFSSLLVKTSLNEKQTSYINQIQSSGQLLLGIIDDILDISKLEAGKIKLESLDFNLEDLIHDIFKMIVVRMKGHPFDTYVDIDPGLNMHVKGDPTRLKQIFVNLLGNSFKFTSKGSIGIIVKKQDLSSDPDVLEYFFNVKDTGIGIAPENIKKLFTPFTQADGSTTRNFGGTGLGLSICKSLVEVMGGRIWVESALGHGSQFMFTIKFKKGSAAAQESTDAFQNILDGQRVFIIDDNQMARVIIGKCCEQMGLKSLGEADSGQGALQKLSKLFTEQGIVPDLVLCDIIMESMDGYELVEKIKAREEYKHVRFIAVTSDITAEGAGQKKQEVFDAYIVKPINVKGLTDVITKVMGYERKTAFKENVEASSFKDIKVLVAEDSVVNQMLFQEYFDVLGCRVDFANNGKEAMEKLRSNRYNLVFMDLQMPVMGGIEATGIIHEEISKDIPIIALTASVMKADREKAEIVGMADFLTKPVSLDKLREKIEQYGKKHEA